MEPKKPKLLPKVHIPLVDVDLPEVNLPVFPPKIPVLNPEDFSLLRFALMDDLGDLIPVVGDPFADLAYARLREKMGPGQYEKFLQDNKWLPSTLATLKVIVEEKT